MPICITCSTPVKHLYTTYSKADDRALGKGVRLTQCPNCKRFADKYVEHDFVVLFIDLVLIKPQVYRHLLFNRLGRADDKLDPSILRLGTLLVLFDVYITWARIERSTSTSNPNNTPAASNPSPPALQLAELPILTQYLFFLTMNVLATLAQHGIIRLLARLFLARPGRGHGAATMSVSSFSPLQNNSHSSNTNYNNISTSTGPTTTTTMSPNTVAGGGVVDKTSTSTSQPLPPPKTKPSPTLPSNDSDKTTKYKYTVGPGHASPSAISTALLVSSCTKLFPILLVIWPTDTSTSTSASASGQKEGGGGLSLLPFASRASSYVGWAVLLNNIEALLILLDCGYVVAIGLAGAGVLARWVVEGWALGLVGLGGSNEAGGLALGFGLGLGSLRNLWNG